jgi:thiosulfate reductase cytochrome b subunit
MTPGGNHDPEHVPSPPVPMSGSGGVARVHRHNRAVRICHWINVIAFGYLVVSGVHIFLDFPELYWGKVGFRGHEAAFRLADWGISWDQAGAWGNRRWGRNYHYLFAWIAVLNGMVYVAWNLWNKHFRRNMLPARSDLTPKSLGADLREHLRPRRRKSETAGRYGILQKISYLIVIFVVTPFMILSGLAQMPAFTAISPELIDLFGGRQTARTLHVIGMLWMLIFLLIHLVEIMLAGAVREVRAMITGRYPARPEGTE